MEGAGLKWSNTKTTRSGFTTLDAAGAALPSEIDGESLLSLAHDPANAAWREDLMLEYHGHGIHHFQRSLRWKNYKYVAHLEDLDELYDLHKDPFELQNLINDPSMINVLEEMRERLARWMNSRNDDSPDARKLLASF